MHVKWTRWFLLPNLFFGIVLAREGMMGDLTDGELPPLKAPQGVERKPESGAVNQEDVENGINMECKLTEETESELKNGKQTIVKDMEWKWVILEVTDTNEETEIPLKGQLSSKLDPEGLRDAIKERSGWIRLKCSSGDNFAEFRVDAGNSTKGPKLSFRVKKFDKSINVVEKEDKTIFCHVVNRTVLKLKPEESVEEGIKRITGN